MTTNNEERDFISGSIKLRFPGRFDPITLQNTDDAGDGFPGLQKAMRNHVNNTIIPAHATLTGVHGIGTQIDAKITTHSTLTGVHGIDSQIDAKIAAHSTVTGVHGLPVHVATSDAHHSRYTDTEARAAINNIFNSSGQATTTIDWNGNSIDNINDIDNNIYYCSTETDINNALTAIGSNGGTIIIESGSISLTGTINISGGGSYLIIGQGFDTIIDCNGNRTAFNITSAASCILRDFKILCDDITDTTGAIIINEGSDNKVVVDNVAVDGTGNGEDAYAIILTSDNNIVKNCIILEVRRALEITGNNNIIDKCHIYNIDAPNGTADVDGTDCYAINISGSDNKITNNIIESIEAGQGGTNSVPITKAASGGDCYAIYTATGSNNIISNNHLFSIKGGQGGSAQNSGEGGDGGHCYCIYIGSLYSQALGNNIHDCNGGLGGLANNEDSGDGGHCYCIYGAASNISIKHNMIESIIGGTIADSGNGELGIGGNGYGIYNTQPNTIIDGNNIKTIAGGEGGYGYGTGDGGDGGDAYGIYNEANFTNTNNNNIETLDGGDGGDCGITVGGNGGDSWGIQYNNCTDGVINGNVGTDIDVGAAGSGGGSPGTTAVGLADAGTANWNIWTSNNFRGEGEALTGANNVEANNLT